MSARLDDIQEPNLLGPYGEMYTLYSQVRSLFKIHIPIIHLVIAVFIQPLPKASNVVLNIFVDNDLVSVVGDKSGHEEQL